MATNVFPSASRLQLIQQEYVANAMLEDPILKHLPLVTTDDHYLEWEQKDNYRGLQLARGLNGMPSLVSQVGAKRFRVEPGVYGEFSVIDENIITVKRQLGTYSDYVDLRGEVEDKSEQLAVRQATRIRQIIWTLLTTGNLEVLGPAKQKVYADAYTFQTHSSSPALSSVSTAKPLSDFRTIQLKGAGKGAVFNGKAVVFMRQVSLNYILANTNADDLGGRLANAGSKVNNLNELNRYLLDDNLPQIEVMDEGYFDEDNNFQYYIPAGKAVVIGARQTGETLGEYRMTRNANNQGARGGPYAKVVDKTKDNVPPSVEVHAGHNGGVVLYYPSAICLWTMHS